MAKNNAYLARQRLQKAMEMEHQRQVATQFCLDAAILAADAVFEPDADTIAKFAERFKEALEWLADLTVDDAKDDKEIDYAKGKLDELLKKAWGDKFSPWEERYGFGKTV